MKTYPKGWFDLSPEKYADLGAMLYLSGLTATLRHRSLTQAIYGFETPLRLGQYQIFRQNGFPRGFVTFGGLSPQAEHRLAVEGQPLRDKDLASGTSFWILDMVAPFGQTRKIVDILKQNIPHQRVRTNRPHGDVKKPRVVEWNRDTTGAIRTRVYRREDFAQLLAAEAFADGVASSAVSD